MKTILSKALNIASTAHKDQFDKAGEPYILHCLQVMNNLETDNEELQCIAILHDTIEDTWVTADYLRVQGFSDFVVNAVIHLTKFQGQSSEEYLERVMQTEETMLVKLADLKHNSCITRLKGATEKDIKRTEKYHKMYLAISNKLKGD